MTAKSNKIKFSEEFMAIRRDEQALWDVQSPLRREKNEKTSVLEVSKECQINLRFFQTDIFELSLFQMRNLLMRKLRA